MSLLLHSHYYSFAFSITLLSRNIVVILRSKCHFISFITRKASSKFETRDSRETSPCRIANHYLIICALIPLLIHRLTRSAKAKRRCSPRCHFAVNGNTVLHLPGARGPLVQTRGPGKRHPAEVVGRLRRQVRRCSLTRLRSHVTHGCWIHARNPWVMYVPIYHAQSNRAGKMRNRGDERDERGERERDRREISIEET